MPDSIKRLIWPLSALLLLLLFNLIVDWRFYRLSVHEGKLSGTVVDIAQNAAPTMIVALGMTLVIATGGVDLSVGALMALAGSTAAVLLTEHGAPLLWAITAAFGVCLLAGLWNGVLVSYLRVQPIVATLILMVAGRGMAQLLTDGQIISVADHPGFKYIDGGDILGIPFPIWIMAFTFTLLAALTRWTALGLFIEAVGGNETASRFAGLSVRPTRVAVYAVSGVCACVAGLIVTSDITAADANNAGNYLELDAILAVVIGGTALTGGRFSLIGSLLGALIIQTLTTTILRLQFGGTSIPPEYNLVAKAIVVLIVCLAQSEALQSKLFSRRGVA